MRIALVVSLVAALCATACVSSAPPVSDTVLRFESAGDLDEWVVTAGEWTVSGNRLVGRSVDPTGTAKNEFATFGTFFGDVERVIVRGGLDAASPHNFRMAMGPAAQIFNWELAPACWFNVGRHERRVEGAPLVPGQEHEMVVEQVGDRVRVVVDDRLLWEGPGRLNGTLTLHPTLGSSLWVREIVIRGRPVPWVEVTGPSVPPL